MRSGVESVAAAYVGVRGGVGREKGGESRRGKRERKGIKTDREGKEEGKKKRWRRRERVEELVQVSVVCTCQVSLETSCPS